MKDCICRMASGPCGLTGPVKEHDMDRFALHLTKFSLAGADPIEFGLKSLPGRKVGRFNHLAKRG